LICSLTYNRHNTTSSGTFKKKLEAIELALANQIQSLTVPFTTSLSQQFEKISDKLEPVFLIKDSLIKEMKKTDVKAEEVSRKLAEKQHEIESKLQFIHEICTNLKTQRIQEAEEKRDQLREMIKQVNSLSELAQHTQVWNLTIVFFFFSSNIIRPSLLLQTKGYWFKLKKLRQLKQQ
jgi:DNA repair exonuclease SbcCD ATPase subunit